MKILFFDSETNGLPIDYKASYTDVDNWPRVISLAWILADENRKVHAHGYDLIYPDGWEMPTEKFWTDKGYTQENNIAHGKKIADVLTLFLAAKQEADLLVAHNLNFDHRIVWAEFIRAGMEPRSGMNKLCTMMKGTSVAKIPAAKGRGYKWPKLEELYTFLFRAQMENAHDAGADVRACMDCFYRMIDLGAISLDEFMPKPAEPVKLQDDDPFS